MVIHMPCKGGFRSGAVGGVRIYKWPAACMPLHLLQQIYNGHNKSHARPQRTVFVEGVNHLLEVGKGCKSSGRKLLNRIGR